MSDHRDVQDRYRRSDRDRLDYADALARANEAAAAYREQPSDKLARRYARLLERIGDGLRVDSVDGRSTG